MASEIRANSITSRAGLSTVTMTDSGPMFSGITTFVDNSGFTFGVGGGTSIFTPATNILTLGTNNTEKVRIDANGNANITGVTTAANFKTGVSNLHNAGLTLSGGQLDVGSNIKVGTAGVITATSFVGSGANLTSLPAQATIANNADNRVITGGSGVNLNGEAQLTFTNKVLDLQQNNNSTNTINGTIQFSNVNHTVAKIEGSTRTTEDDGDIKFYTKNSGTFTEALRLSFHTEPKLQMLAGETEIVSSASDGSLTFRADPGQNRSSTIIKFEIDNSEKLRIDSSGRLGLGTNNPDTLFHIKDASNSAMMRLESSSYSSYIAQIQSNNNVGNGSLAGNLYLRGQSGVQMSGNGGTATQFALDGTALSITGTTDGVLNLDTSDSRGSFIRFKQGGATEAWVGCGQGMGLGSSTTLAFRSDADIRIRTGAEEHVTITTDGMFAAKGQAGQWIYNNHPANYTGFHQFSSSKNGDWMMQFRQEHHNGLGFVMRVNNNNANEAIALYRESSSNYGFKVYNTGNVGNINNSYGSLSDVSLKENIVDAKSQWDDIKAIKVRNFNLKSDTDKVKMLGVVAQELETVSPKLVYEDKEGMKGVHYSVLYMKAIKALQEAIIKIETLEQDNIALRARVTNLEGN